MLQHPRRIILAVLMGLVLTTTVIDLATAAQKGRSAVEQMQLQDQRRQAEAQKRYNQKIGQPSKADQKRTRTLQQMMKKIK